MFHLDIISDPANEFLPRDNKDLVNAVMFHLVIISDAANEFLPRDNKDFFKLNSIEYPYCKHLNVLTTFFRGN